MTPLVHNDEHLSGDEDHDDGFADDMEALRRACMLTGANVGDIVPSSSPPASASGEAGRSSLMDGETVSGSDSEDDFELFRNIQERLSLPKGSCETLYMQPLCALPPASDDEEDDFETLAAVRRRFVAYSNIGTSQNGPETVEVSDRNTLVERNSASEVADIANLSSSMEMMPATDLAEEREPDILNLSVMELKDSGFPKSAQMFIDAIKKNRSCQKFIRSKLIDIEAKIERNKKLMERVKILKNFQAKCRMFTGKALSLKQDSRVQLISARREKGNDKKVSARYSGPEENFHVANYRLALANFPLTFTQKKWTKEEEECLRKGIVQQFQEKLVQFSMDRISVSEDCAGNANYMDSMLASIRDLEITPEKMREFLPKVNWDQLAALYVPGHSGAECEAHWLNFGDPLINHCPRWTSKEDKYLLHIVQEKGVSNWFDIAASLGTNRTPFKCLERFQRSLNASMLKREWTQEEDAQLHAAVEAYGEHNWQAVASTLVGRTGPQCSNRWNKTLHPNRQKVGRWTVDEDKRLRIAVKLFGPKNWDKIAQFVLGRLPPQCRERWVNCLDPSLNHSLWTEEEDSRLKAAINEYGYRWSMIAKCLAPRTDNQCRRRWKVLAPDEVPLLQAARKVQKVALISNFVDRETERPAIGPHDFLPLATISGPEQVNRSRKNKRKSRKCIEEHATSGNALKKIRVRRRNKKLQMSSGEVPGIIPTQVNTLLENHPVVTESMSSEETAKISDTQIGTLPENHSVVTESRMEPFSAQNIYDDMKLSESSIYQEVRLESPELRVTNIEDVERSLLDGTPNTGSKPLKVYQRRRKITKPHLSASVPSRRDSCKKSKPKCKTHVNQILELQDDDNVTLASLRSKKTKKKHDCAKKAGRAVRLPTS